MNIVPTIAPIVVVPIVLAAVVAVARKTGHDTREGFEIFFYPRALAYLMGFCSVWFMAIPYLPRMKRVPGDWPFIAFFFAFSAFVLAAAVYFHRYRVIIGTETFTVGAFWPREYSLRDISKVELVKRQRSGGRYFVYMRTGKKLAFDSFLADLSGPSQTACPARAGMSPNKALR